MTAPTPGPSGPAERDVAVRPKAFWYWIGAGLIALGVVSGAVIFVVAFQGPLDKFRDIGDEIDSFQRFRVPGTATLHFSEAGDQFIYIETDDSAFDTTVDLDPTSVTVRSTTPDSPRLAVRSVPFTETFNFNGPSEQTSLEFTVPEPGDYRMTVADDIPLRVRTLAVGPPLDVSGALKAAAVAFVVPLGVGGTLMIAGGIILIVVGVRRSGSRRRLRMATGAPPGAWGYPPAGAPTWPPPGAPSSGYSPAGAYPPSGAYVPPPPSPTWPPPQDPPSAPPPP